MTGNCISLNGTPSSSRKVPAFQANIFTANFMERVFFPLKYDGTVAGPHTLYRQGKTSQPTSNDGNIVFWIEGSTSAINDVLFFTYEWLPSYERRAAAFTITACLKQPLLTIHYYPPERPFPFNGKGSDSCAIKKLFPIIFNKSSGHG